MAKYVAFLRAINVGGHIVKMDHLRALFEEIGLSNVETFIASGNVRFDSRSTSASALEGKIEKHLHQKLGYEVATFLRDLTQVVEVVNDSPFKDEEKTEGNIVYVGFVKETPTAAAKQRLFSLATPANRFQVNGREVYWLRRKTEGVADYAGQTFEKALGMKVTFRGLNTIKRLAAKYC